MRGGERRSGNKDKVTMTGGRKRCMCLSIKSFSNCFKNIIFRLPYRNRSPIFIIGAHRCHGLPENMT